MSKFIKVNRNLLIVILVVVIGLPIIILTPSPIGVIPRDIGIAIVGYCGSIIGGFLTLYGVWWTIDDSQKARSKELELQHMPILKLKTSTCCLKDWNHHGIYTLSGDEFYTTGFPADESLNYPIIEIALASPNPALDVRIDSCITTEHKKEPKQTECYFPQEYRLVGNEKILNMFWIKDYNKYPHINVQGVLRIAYSDVFGNPYYQDIGFSYNEQVFDSKNMLSLKRVMSPVLADSNAPTLLERVQKEYSYLYERGN